MRHAHWWMKGKHEPVRWWVARLLRGRVDLRGYGDGRIDSSHALQHAIRCSETAALSRSPLLYRCVVASGGNPVGGLGMGEQGLHQQVTETIIRHAHRTPSVVTTDAVLGVVVEQAERYAVEHPDGTLRDWIGWVRETCSPDFNAEEVDG